MNFQGSVMAMILSVAVFGLARSAPQIEFTQQRSGFGSCASCECGETYRNVRIVGGRPTEVNAYPWMAGLQISGQIVCGGTLINDRYIMTAAHCLVAQRDMRNVKVILGEHDQSTTGDSRSMSVNVERAIVHPDYQKGARNNNDIALLRLERAVVVSREVNPACLASRGQSFSGKKGTVIGWGKTDDDDPTSLSPVLREVEVEIFPNKWCVEQYSYVSSPIFDTMLCAGHRKGKKDSCKGDSGGPLHAEGSGKRKEVVGIVSTGRGCGSMHFPGVYARVSSFLHWIEENTRDACPCN